MVPVFLLFGGSCLALCFFYLRSNRQHQDKILDRLWSLVTYPAVPPPSVPLKEKHNTNELIDMFPPHRRTALASLQSGALKGHRPATLELSEQPPEHEELPSEGSACNLDTKLDRTTPTGFTSEEIARLGDFPDYATLSGIPLPKTYEDFDIAMALARPYRPYRWPYHQTMSLSKLDTDFWLELDRDYASRIQQRLELFEKYGPEVLQVLPGSEPACKELMEISLQFLCARYPQYFSFNEGNTIFRNDVLNTQTDLKSTQPLHVLLHNIPEDFAIMIRDPYTGLYSLRAGVIMSAVGFSVGEKIGMQLSEIHSAVPGYKEKMQFSMDRFFAKMPTDRGIQRGSWSLEMDHPYFLPPGDPQLLEREKQHQDLTVERCHLRVDWQTLRRLPLSGSMVFNFKGLFTPLQEFRDEPGIPSLVLKVLRDGHRDIIEYKSTWHVEHVVIPTLEEYEREQIERGLLGADWEAQTMDEAPFFPGWKEKWHRQQGF